MIGETNSSKCDMMWSKEVGLCNASIATDKCINVKANMVFTIIVLIVEELLKHKDNNCIIQITIIRVLTLKK